MASLASAAMKVIRPSAPNVSRQLSGPSAVLLPEKRRQAMNGRIGRDLLGLTLLVAAGCSSGGSGAKTGQGGGTAGSAGGGGAAGSAGSAGGGVSWLTPPPIAPALVTPYGATVAIHVHAVGVQIYTCTASAGGGADAG